MREIKFRAWTEHGLPFGKGGLCPVWSITFNHSAYLIIPKESSPYKDQDYWQVMNDDLILMQYTGLHDKNGKEIYEGDILDFENGYITEIFWDRGGFRLNDLLIRDDLSHGIIIGNIYENPELLTPKKDEKEKENY